MSALSDSLNELFNFLTRQGLTSPSKDVRFIEVSRETGVDSKGRVRISRESLHTPVEFEARFQEILAFGPPWMNVSCYGVYEGMMVVGIEIPDLRQRTGSVSGTSINYSGPPAAVLEHGWNALEILSIE
jgi:hypothetical protein